MPQQDIQQSPAREQRTASEIEEIVTLTRLHLYNRDLPCGAKAIQNHLATEYAIAPLPSETAISDILRRQGLTNRRTGTYDE